MDWIDLTQDRDQWRGLLNTAENLRVYKMLGILEWLQNCRHVKKGSAPSSYSVERKMQESVQLEAWIRLIALQISVTQERDYKDILVVKTNLYLYFVACVGC
jgi:hypothetical protein